MWRVVCSNSRCKKGILPENVTIADLPRFGVTIARDVTSLMSRIAPSEKTEALLSRATRVFKRRGVYN